MKCEYCQRVILYEDAWWVIRYLCDEHGYKCCHTRPPAVRAATPPLIAAPVAG